MASDSERRNFLGAPSGMAQILQILYNANDGFHRLF